MKDELKVKLLEGIEVIDERQRKIKVRKPNFLAELRLTEALGKSADNERYFNMLYRILWVASTDDIPFPIGTTKREVEAAYERLGEEGMIAIAKAINILFEEELSDEDIAKKEIEEIESVKKSQETHS